MVTRQDLIYAVEQAVSALTATYRGDADESDLYEASLFAVAHEAARRAGADLKLTIDGSNPATQLTFRRSPGSLWAGAHTYAIGSFPNSDKRIEIHLGVKVAGSSGVAHECDVAVLDASEAERSRVGFVHPRKRGLIAAIEAKHYASSPGIDVGRAFLGLGTELTQNKCHLAFPAQTSQNLASLLAKKPSECIDRVTPASTSEERLTSLIEQRIRNWIAQ